MVRLAVNPDTGNLDLFSGDGGIATPVSVPDGGTGVGTLEDGGFMLGSGTDPVTVTARPTAGQIPIGETAGDPSLAQITSGDGIDVDSVSGAITVNLITPVTVANGGTGATTLTDGGFIFGSGTSAVTSTAQPANGQIPVGRGGMDPILATISGGTGITVVNGSGTITTNLDSPVLVSNGGTGGVTHTDGGFVLGSAATALTTTARPTAGQIPIGETAGDPSLSTLSFGPGIDILNASGSISVNNVGPSVGISNIGFAYDSGTGIFRVTSQDSTPLSSTNKGYVTIWSRTSVDPGRLITIEITADQSFIDANGASEIVGNLFGTTAGVAYNLDCPFAVLAIINNAQDEIAFCLSRNLFLRVAPTTANIGAPDDPVADKQNDAFSFENRDESLLANNQSLPIGEIQMRKDSSDDWTVQGLLAGSTGINAPSNWSTVGGSDFNVPVSHFGAATGTYFRSNGGTAPIFTTNTMRFHQERNTIRVWLFLTGDGGTDGAGAVPAQVTIPYTSNGTPNTSVQGVGKLVSPGYNGTVTLEPTGGQSYFLMVTTVGATILNSDFSNGNRIFQGQMTYTVGNNPP